MGLRVVNQLRENIRALLRVRKIDQKDLAFALRRHPTWINKFLKGTRPIHIHDMDGIADFFGLTAYQLLQPGISAVTERRKGYDRRAGQDRRVGHAQRQLRTLAAEVDLVRAPKERRAPHEADKQRAAAARARITADIVDLLDRLFEEADAGGQTPKARQAVPKSRQSRRAAGGSDAPKG